MLRSSKGHIYILCIIDEITNHMITAAIKHSRSEEVGEALINDVIFKVLHNRLYYYGFG